MRWPTLFRRRGWPVPVPRPEGFPIQGDQVVERWPFPDVSPVVDAVLRTGELARRGLAVHPAANCLPRQDEQARAAHQGVVTPAAESRQHHAMTGCSVDERTLMCRTHQRPREVCLLGEIYAARRYVAVEPMVVNARMHVVLRGPRGAE